MSFIDSFSSGSSSANSNSSNSNLNVNNLNINNIIEKIINIKKELENILPGRSEQIEVAIYALMSSLPALFISPPGTGKTMLIEKLAESITRANYFYILLNQFTEPKEILGPIDIVALKNGEYRRITTGKLPKAHIAFFDEIFKASSAIRNTLLDIILNKRIMDGTTYKRIPLRALYTASNEISHDEEDAAIYDRLVLRSFFDYVDLSNISLVIERGVLATATNTSMRTKLTLEEVDVVQEKVKEKAVELARNNKIRSLISAIVVYLRNNGIMISDRRVVQYFFILASDRLLYPNKKIKISIADTISHVFINSKKDKETIEEALEELGFYGNKEQIEKIKTLINEASKLFEEFEEKHDLITLKSIKTIVNKLNDELNKIEYVPTDIENKVNELTTRLRKIIEELNI